MFDSDKPEYALPGARYKRWASAVEVKAEKVRGTYVFREAIKAKR